jgi:hypothetical protein
VSAEVLALRGRINAPAPECLFTSVFSVFRVNFQALVQAHKILIDQLDQRGSGLRFALDAKQVGPLVCDVLLKESDLLATHIAFKLGKRAIFEMFDIIARTVNQGDALIVNGLHGLSADESHKFQSMVP